MRTRCGGSASVWMLLVVLLMLAAALGVARVGRASGDYVRRQVTADAAAASAAGVLEERLRHIGRLQEAGMAALEEDDVERAQEIAQTAWMIADRTIDALEAEAAEVAAANGAKHGEVAGLPSSARRWFVPTPSSDPEIEWVSLSPEFRKSQITVVVWQSDAEGTDRPARASTRISVAWPEGPLVGEGTREETR